MKKIILIALVGCLIIAGFIVWKVKSVDTTVSQPKTTTEVKDDWKVYENTKYKYRISVPALWATENTHDETILIFGHNNPTQNILGAYIRVFYFGENLKNLPIQDWWKKNGPQIGRQAPYPDTEKLIKVGGEDAYYTVYDSESSAFGYEKLAAVFIYIGHNGKVYEISGGVLPTDPAGRGLTAAEVETAKKYEEIFNKILESFQFTDTKI